MTKRIGPVAAVLSLTVAAGCVEGVRVFDEYRGSGSYGLLQWAARTGEVALDVRGDVPGLDHAALAAAAERGLAGTGDFNARYTARPDASTRPGYRMVVTVDPPPTMRGDALCGPAAPVAPPAAAAGGQTIALAFCDGKEVVASAIGQRGAGPATAEAVTQTVSAIAGTLFTPPRPRP